MILRNWVLALAHSLALSLSLRRSKCLNVLLLTLMSLPIDTPTSEKLTHALNSFTRHVYAVD